MVFSSIVFLLYFLPLFLLVYYLADQKYKNIIILIFSIFFYSWGAPKFIFVILFTTLLDFYLVRFMWQTEDQNKRKWMLALSVSVNLGLLFYFKYSNFFIENVNSILTLFGARNVYWTKIILPIGISFYTFETITYVVDVYRKIHKPLDKFWDYQLYIILFPKLIAGPIIRYHELADQISDRSQFDNVDNRLRGFYRFCIGLAKKVLIANQMGIVADEIFGIEKYQDLGSLTAWVGILAYTFQIYFDFSGYSDMAIGIARMIGFRFPENFDNPYTSQSITEFWRRWHITLGRWMRNYLYIPLGGNKVESQMRIYFNLWIVFLASGLWHGASWSFIFWGAYHGAFLIMERVFLNKFYLKIGGIASMIVCFFIVVIGWVFFRVEHFGDAVIYLKQMFAFQHDDSFHITSEFLFYFVIAIFFAFFIKFPKGNFIHEHFYFKDYSNKKHIYTSLVSILLLVLCIASISTLGFNPFIYFRF